jgi:hypothetical protein
VFKDRLLTIVTTLLFVLGAGSILWVFVKNWNSSRRLQKMGHLECVQERTTVTIDDDHMVPILDKGQSVQVLQNYYQCNRPARGQLVWYRFSPNIPPVVRVLAGIPGDRFEVKKISGHRWGLKINDVTYQSLSGEDYFIDIGTIPPLHTLEISRGGLLKDNEFIVLSAKPPGLSDSSNLGAVRGAQLAGRVLSP